jgi:phosphate transport system protein
MGARCERLVGVAFDAFRNAAPNAARDARSLDEQIDRDDVELHGLILRMLALRQPVAADLRFLVTALRLVTDLERVGDEAVNIAERAAGSNGAAKKLAMDQLDAMAAEARDMLHGALQSFVDSDLPSAEHILECDDRVDALCKTIIADMVGRLGQRTDEIRPGLCVIGVAKYLERVADHATNIAEEVIFILSGDDVRHGHWLPQLEEPASTRSQGGAPSRPA